MEHAHRPRLAARGPRAVLLVHSSAGRYGADRQLLALARGLDPARWRAHAVLAEDGPLVDDLRAAGVPTAVRRLAVLRREHLSAPGLAGVAAAWAADTVGLARLARRAGARVVHTNTSVTLGGAPAAALLGLPHVWHVREIYAGFERAWPLHGRALLTADALPCVSPAVAAQFAGLGRPERVRVLPDGLALAPDGASRAEARALLGLPADAWIVAVLGRLSAWKGHGLLIDALARPPLRDDPAVVAVLAGAAWRDDPAVVRDLRARAAAHGLTDRVLLPGFVDRPGLLYAAADVVAVPSTRPDPLPNAALEAAAAGRCVVAADHGGLREILDGGRTGVLVRPGDASALARALGALRADPARTAALGARAAADVPHRYGAAALAARTQDLYDAVLARRGALS